MTDNPESAVLALGKLIGTVDGLVKAIDEQNKTAASSRMEFLKVFEGIRSDNKEVVTALEDHVREDLIYHGAMNEFVNWKKEAEAKVDTLWDNQNKQRGFLVAVGIAAGFLGSFITGIWEWYKHG